MQIVLLTTVAAHQNSRVNLTGRDYNTNGKSAEKSKKRKSIHVKSSRGWFSARICYPVKEY